MKISYINTDTKIDSGLFRTQVLPLENFASEKFDVEIINIRSIFSNSKKNRYMELVGWPMRYSNNIFWNMPLLVSAFIISLRLMILKKNVIFVGRGYYGGLIGYYLCKFGKQFVWDPRSIYPLEELGSGKFKKGSLAFSFWLRMEKKILSVVNGVIVVSSGHGKYYRRFSQYGVTKKVPTMIVPCFASFMADKKIIPDTMTIKSLEKLEPTNPKIVYFGSLDYKWNNLNLYLPVFDELIKKGFNLVVLTQSAVKQEIREYLSKYPKLDTRLLIKNVGDPDLQSNILHECDFGLMIMSKVPDWFSRIGVKFATYRSAGLPVLVSKNFGGAISILKKSNQKSYVLAEDIKTLKADFLSESERAEIKDQSYQLFSVDNFFKVIEKLTQHRS